MGHTQYPREGIYTQIRNKFTRVRIKYAQNTHKIRTNTQMDTHKYAHGYPQIRIKYRKYPQNTENTHKYQNTHKIPKIPAKSRKYPHNTEKYAGKYTQIRANTHEYANGYAQDTHKYAHYTQDTHGSICVYIPSRGSSPFREKFENEDLISQ